MTVDNKSTILFHVDANAVPTGLVTPFGVIWIGRLYDNVTSGIDQPER